MTLKYLISYITEDSQNLGSNAFWHAGVMLSAYDVNTGRMEVVGSWGLHSDPVELDDSLVSHVKNKLGLKFRLTGGSGTIKEEAIRDLDRGVGLYGRHIEITEKQAKQFQRNIRLKLMMQADAIEESKAQLRTKLRSEGVDDKDIDKLMTNEAIFNTEIEHITTKSEMPLSKQKAKDVSRLRRFEILPSDITNSNVCKVEAIKMLQEIGIDESILHELRGNTFTYVVPRCSGTQTPVYAHSEGTHFMHKRRHGKLSRYRVWGPTQKEMAQLEEKNPRRASAKVFWTLPPIYYDSLDNHNTIPTLDKALQQKIMEPYTRLIKLRKIIESSSEAAKSPIAQSKTIDKIETLLKRMSHLTCLSNNENVKSIITDIDILIDTIHTEIVLDTPSTSSTNEKMQLTEEEISQLKKINIHDEHEPSICYFPCLR